MGSVKKTFPFIEYSYLVLPLKSMDLIGSRIIRGCLVALR